MTPNHTLPKKEVRCTEVLSDTLRGYAGIEEVHYDYTTGSLKAVYNPHLLSNEQALQVIQHAGQEASTRVSQCASRREHGESACLHCAGELGKELEIQYQTAAKLPTAAFSHNAVEVRLNQAHLAASENIAVEAKFLTTAQVDPLPRGVPMEQVEVIFTLINAVMALAAFRGCLITTTCASKPP